jgi:hypothetical protein
MWVVIIHSEYQTKSFSQLKKCVGHNAIVFNFLSFVMKFHLHGTKNFGFSQ